MALNLKELKDWLNLHYEDRIDAIVLELFRQADQDKDKQLTSDEIWKHHTLFIGHHNHRQHGSVHPDRVKEGTMASSKTRAGHGQDGHDEL
eukprot:m.145739 g.145739  ORF g.145739 m.145739 type:complete len:91 (+) comp16219_c0_seq14:724-996(+)